MRGAWPPGRATDSAAALDIDKEGQGQGAERDRLGGGPGPGLFLLLLGLKTVQIVGGALRLAGGRDDDEALVILQRLE